MHVLIPALIHRPFECLQAIPDLAGADCIRRKLARARVLGLPALILVTGGLALLPQTTRAADPVTIRPPPTPSADKKELPAADAPATPVRAAGDEFWSQFLTNVQAPNPSDGGTSSNPDSAAAQAAQCADQAKDFYTRFPQHAKAAEAHKLEAVLLVNAVTAGDTQLAARMESTVQAVRADPSLPAFDRAVVAGTYEFSQAGKRIKSRDDAIREFEAVSRGLIREFPDQPQGYISLLTQAMQHDDDAARAMVTEVINSAAPEEVRAQARRLANRLGLIGQTIDKILGSALAQAQKTGWQEGRPGLIYFWATWSPDSLGLGEMLAGRKLPGLNVLGICLDQNGAAAASAATARQLPGQLIYVPGGLDGPLAIQLGASGAPLVYLTDARGTFTDVRGIDDLEAKLKAMGL